MTCIISYTENSKVYMGADTRISYSNESKVPLDNLDCKIKKSQSYMIGFAGNKGFADLFTITQPCFDIWKNTYNPTYEEVVQKLCNIFSLFKNESNPSSVIYSNGSRASLIENTGLLIHDYEADYKDLLVIGTGIDLVRGVFEATPQSLPEDKIKESIKIVAKYYPKIVGGAIDMCTI